VAITDKNKENIMFLFVHLGLVTPLTAVLQSGANLECTDKAGRRALELAKDDATFEALKAGGPTMSDMTHEKKKTLLIEYAGKGLTGGVLMALQAGADANHKDREGNSCLHIAAAQGSNDILCILLNAGAKITAKNKGGMTDLALACVKVGNMEKLSWSGASADEAPHGLTVGRW
jgi:hypothetical protein